MVSPGASSTVVFKLSMSLVKVLVPSVDVQLILPRCQSPEGSVSASVHVPGWALVDRL